jgi:archaemetzincin
MEIVIQPVLTGLDDNTLNELTEAIRTELEHIRLTVTNVVHNPAIIQFNRDVAFESAFDIDRNQWNSPQLLDWFYKSFKPKKDSIILLILDVDAYSSGLNFVLGQAFPHRRLGAVYLPRIKEEFYGLKPNNELFYERMVKECVHELGHIFGFNHCPDMLCVMHFSNSLSDTDFKRKSFCATCRIKKPIF